MIVTRIRPLSLAKVTTAVYAAIGLFIGVIFAGISLVGAAIGLASQAGPEPWFGALFGVGAIVAAPIFYGLLGFLGGLFTAFVYNLAARALGGVEFEVQDR
jgi:hypothetical protein